MAQVDQTPTAKVSAISIVGGKELLLEGLVDETGNDKKYTKCESTQVFVKWTKLNMTMIRNIIFVAHRFYKQGGQWPWTAIPNNLSSLIYRSNICHDYQKLKTKVNADSTLVTIKA